ncbi:hypothetical protein QTP70_018545 [Hemibagrus guttatus]|uniref:Protein kish-A n=1 Tax=Hemibagrus guttatus TaxID=175788 RepID=A0AAE0QK49_9TELE|nr:hypothetical protein QTP70_018545 [Hemibagrus guttatus]KAK3550238.1 hypothetical protein QTP86_021283 [Hemibagrus guttatus]
MSAIFNFQSLLTVILLLICTCAYIRALAPSLLDKNKTGKLEIHRHRDGLRPRISNLVVAQGFVMQVCNGILSRAVGKPRFASFFTTLRTLYDAALYSSMFPLASPELFLGIFWKCARIGERKSPYVACCCIIMAFTILFSQ